MKVRSEDSGCLFYEISVGECFAFMDTYYLKTSMRDAVCLATGELYEFDEDDPDVHKVDAELVIHHVY